MKRLISIFFLLTVFLFSACKEKVVNCDCDIPNNCFYQKNVSHDSIPSDLTSIISYGNSGKKVMDEFFRVIKDSCNVLVDKRNYPEEIEEYEQEISDWFGGVDVGANGNLYNGLKIDGIDEFGGDFNFFMKAHEFELIAQGMTYPDSTNSYKAKVIYRIEIRDLNKNRVYVSTELEESRMIKTCRLYEFDDSNFKPLNLNRNFHKNTVN